MPRARSPNRDKAFEMWADSKGTLKLQAIADELGVPASKVRKWKTLDDWESKIPSGALHLEKGSAPKRKKGGQRG